MDKQFEMLLKIKEYYPEPEDKIDFIADAISMILDYCEKRDLEVSANDT